MKTFPDVTDSADCKNGRADAPKYSGRKTAFINVENRKGWGGKSIGSFWLENVEYKRVGGRVSGHFRNGSSSANLQMSGFSLATIFALCLAFNLSRACRHVCQVRRETFFKKLFCLVTNFWAITYYGKIRLFYFEFLASFWLEVLSRYYFVFMEKSAIYWIECFLKILHSCGPCLFLKFYTSLFSFSKKPNIAIARRWSLICDILTKTFPIIEY